MSEAIWGSLAALVLGSFAYWLNRAIDRGMRRHRGQTWERWQIELANDVQQLLEAHLWTAACQAQLAKRIAEIPDEFVAPVFRALRLGYVVERTVLREAEKKGLYDPTKLEDEPGKGSGGVSPSMAPPSASGAVPETTWEGPRLVPVPKAR